MKDIESVWQTLEVCCAMATLAAALGREQSRAGFLASAERCASELGVSSDALLARDLDYKAQVIRDWACTLRVDGRSGEAHAIEEALAEWLEFGFCNNNGRVGCGHAPAVCVPVLHI